MKKIYLPTAKLTVIIKLQSIMKFASFINNSIVITYQEIISHDF